MFVLTGEEKYLKALKALSKENIGKTDFGWTDVSGLASMALLTDKRNRVPKDMLSDYKKIVIAEADRLVKIGKECGYMAAMEPEDYVWGSNMVVLNRGMLLILAAMLSKDEKREVYEKTALAQLHYLLGTNAVGYSYVTGHGENAFKHPHNRPTECDGIELPMPGWVSGGPFKAPCDETAVQNIKAGTPPMKCYLDHAMCYSLNEITIYWNSPTVFLVSYFNKATND